MIAVVCPLISVIIFFQLKNARSAIAPVKIAKQTQIKNAEKNITALRSERGTVWQVIPRVNEAPKKMPNKPK